MKKVKVTFSDGSTEIFHEEQTFMAVNFFADDNNTEKRYPSMSETYQLWSHVHDGLIPSFLEILANSKFFFDVEKPNIYYNSQSVIKIEVI